MEYHLRRITLPAVCRFWLARVFCLVLLAGAQVRSDAFKLLTLMRRPHARRATSTGVWREKFQQMAFLSVLFNAGLICVTNTSTAASLETWQDKVRTPRVCVEAVSNQPESNTNLIGRLIIGGNLFCQWPKVTLRPACRSPSEAVPSHERVEETKLPRFVGRRVDILMYS